MKRNKIQGNILVIDDEKSIIDSMEMILEYEGYSVIKALQGKDGLELFKNNPPLLVFLDIRMPGMDGMEILTSMQNIEPQIPVIMISGHGTIETAVQCTKLGAFDFLEKPLDKERILLTIRNALELNNLKRENRAYKEREKSRFTMIGASKAMVKLKELIRRAGPTNTTVLITGESGTGKELVARAIHDNSLCAKGPFIQVNCAAIPEDLIENELFGHEKGSYTGASGIQRGKFEQAHEGSIFLDEIGDMSLKTQAKVLRVLQEKEYQRVGGSTVFYTDSRVIAATNKDLTEEIRNNNFREDLFFRLNVIPMEIPPLRSRKEDIEPLIQHFNRHFCEENGIKIKKLSEKAIKKLVNYEWSGNIRELKNIVERMVILSDSNLIDVDQVPELSGISSSGGFLPFDPSTMTLKEFKENSERFYLISKLKDNDWNIQKTSGEIDTPRSNLYRKMEQYNIKVESK